MIKPKFRVGRHTKRAILYAETGIEYLIFPEHLKDVAIKTQKYCDLLNNEQNDPVNNWIKYDFNDMKSRPKEVEKYFVHRKDGKIHWETWNGSGFAYNDNVITHYMKVFYPEN